MKDVRAFRLIPDLSHAEYLLLVEALAAYTATLGEAAVVGPEEDQAFYVEDAAQAERLLSRLVPDPATRTRIMEVAKVALDAARPWPSGQFGSLGLEQHQTSRSTAKLS